MYIIIMYLILLIILMLMLYDLKIKFDFNIFPAPFYFGTVSCQVFTLHLSSILNICIRITHSSSKGK
jgi:hypothetical protein